MMTFGEYVEADLDESVVGSGSRLALAAMAKAQGEKAERHFKNAKYALSKVGAGASDTQKIDALMAASKEQAEGLIAVRQQVGAVSGALFLAMK